MPSSIYLAGTEAGSGKSAVAIGLLHRMGRRAGRVAVFRPVVRAGETDVLVEALLAQLPTTTLRAQDACGVTYDDVHADPDKALGTIVDRYHELSEGQDTVLVVGSDFTDVAAPTEFAVNARIAANLGTPMLLVVPAGNRDPDDIATAAEIAVTACRQEHAHVVGVVANQVPEDRLTVLAGYEEGSVLNGPLFWLFRPYAGIIVYLSGWSRSAGTTKLRDALNLEMQHRAHSSPAALRRHRLARCCTPRTDQREKS